MKPNLLEADIYETSASGNQLSMQGDFLPLDTLADIVILPEQKFQTIIGFGGSFTEASAHLLNLLGAANRNKILEAYFGESGARYSLTRTHMNSCDFSLGHYSYAPVEDDKALDHFSIGEDRADIIPMIRDAMAVSKEGFRIIASPWTAPPWMKDNKDWRGGKLLPEYYDTWALFFSKYIDAYKAEGIDIYGFTVCNEPLGNDNNWESMHFTPEEMNEFVKNHLGPTLQSKGQQVKILGFDQNRDEELKKWVDAMYDDEDARAYFAGTAIHWYASTYDYFPEALQYARQKAPDKHLIQTEACIDAEVPKWKDDDWYWAEEATDWGYDWAPAELRHLHPRYTPAFRYARDIIGCLNNWVDGWIDWNMVLDRQGGPNWAKNWCVAPVIADVERDEVYFTPLYYILSHFSKFIRPGAVRIGFENKDENLMVTAAQNPDGSIAIVLFNPTPEAKGIRLALGQKHMEFSISGKALQTIVVTDQNKN
ncbi:MAG: glycoside hydrolase family 30 protein [Bacteroidales bacterium]